MIDTQTLRERRDFLRIAKFGDKWISKSVIVQRAPKPKFKSTPHAKEEAKSLESIDKSDHQNISESPVINVGYTASKKVGNAIKRNRAKRRLREVVRLLEPKNIDSHYEYVFIARIETVDVDFKQLRSDLKWCLKRLGQKKN